MVEALFASRNIEHRIVAGIFALRCMQRAFVNLIKSKNKCATASTRERMHSCTFATLYVVSCSS